MHQLFKNFTTPSYRREASESKHFLKWCGCIPHWQSRANQIFAQKVSTVDRINLYVDACGCFITWNCLMSINAMQWLNAMSIFANESTTYCDIFLNLLNIFESIGWTALVSCSRLGSDVRIVKVHPDRAAPQFALWTVHNGPHSVLKIVANRVTTRLTSTITHRRTPFLHAINTHYRMPFLHIGNFPYSHLEACLS